MFRRWWKFCSSFYFFTWKMEWKVIEVTSITFVYIVMQHLWRLKFCSPNQKTNSKHRGRPSFISLHSTHDLEYYFNGPFLPSFFFTFVFSIQLTAKKLPMTGFELRISGIGGNSSANWATTTAQTTNIVIHGETYFVKVLPNFKLKFESKTWSSAGFERGSTE